MAGGNPASTGVYYHDSWNGAMFPPGTTNCATATPGTEVTYMELVDTVVEVARNAGLRTAWSDKHPANEILNGPSGTAVLPLVGVG